MRPRGRRLTWALVTACAVLYVVLGGAAGDDPLLVELAFTVMTLVYLGVGGLLASRLPRNPVGWLLCSTGFFMALTSITYGYAGRALDPASGVGPDLAVAAAWITSWTWVLPLLGAPTLLFLLFPDGRPTSPAWRPVVWITAAGLGCVLVGSALAEGGLENSPISATQNPVPVLPPSLAEGVVTVGFALSIVALLLAGASLIVRWRRARGIERQQLKWLMWSACPLPIYLVTGLVRWAFDGGSGGPAADLLVVVCLTIVPLAIGIAVMRYRLYDIDVVINRTLVYAALTVCLAAAYLGSVLFLRVALDPLTGSSDLAVAASTLAVAALFRPLRARIQAGVNRRFYRARYDATRTLAGFSAHLRDELDLESLGRDLRDVVRETVQPTHVSVWLREADR
jgi:hypothetical protein